MRRLFGWLTCLGLAGAWTLPAVAGELAEAEVARTYALAALSRGDAAEAARLLEAALRESPGDPSLRALLARARAAGSASPPIAPPPPVAAPPLKAVPPFEGRLGITLGADDNPAALPERVRGISPDGTLFEGAESDRVAELDLRLAVQRAAVEAGGGHLGVTLLAAGARHGDLDALDRQRLQVVVAAAWGRDLLGYLAGPLGFLRVPAGGGRVALLLQGGVQQLNVDGERWQRRAEVAASLVLREARATTTQLDLSWAQESYGAAREEADGSRLALSLAQTLHLGRRDRTLRLSLRGEQRDAGEAFDGETREAAVSLSLPLARRVRLILLGSRRRTEFDQLASNPLFPLPIAEEPREDEVVRGAATLTVELVAGLHLVARGSWARRDSELGPAADFFDFDADRATAALGLAWFFGGGAAARGRR